MGVRKAESFMKRLVPSVLPRARCVFRRGLAGSVGLALICGVSGRLIAQPPDSIDLVSVSITGNAGNGASSGVAVNMDGSVVAFYSDASNLVAGDTNLVRDVFVRDVNAGTTALVSVNSSGAQANGPSQTTGGAPAISADGRFIAFYSDATNLVSNDTNNVADIFVRDRCVSNGVAVANCTATTERVSVATDGSQANGPSGAPSISADGRFVAFQSQASNLVGDDTNNVADIFVRDRLNGTTERVCDTIQGNRYSFSPSISGDGNLVAFASAATNLVPGDTNGRLDVFVCDRGAGAIERVSVDSTGAQGNGDSILPAISGDGHVVAFKSLSSNLVPNDTNNVVDVFAHDRTAQTTERVSVNMNGGNANDFSFPPSISNDGRFVAFGSAATNLVQNDSNLSSNVFVRDRMIAVTSLADVNDLGQEGNQGTPDIPPSISGDGKRVGFVSSATNLVANDRNSLTDVYVAQDPFFGPGKCPTGNECTGGQVCVGGMCVNPTPTATATRTPTITLTPTPSVTPTITPTFVPCTSDSDCKTDEICRGGSCKKKRACDDSNPAVDRNACFGDQETCINGLCECGGDCNLDGFVFVNEIGKALKIVNDPTLLSTCPAADINGDMQVTANEITIAVLNSSENCPQEGRPLIFAHDRGGMVTLTVGSATAAAGQAVAMSVDVSGGNGEVATAQIDLLFDPNTLEIDNPQAACVKDPRLTAETLVATLVDNPPAPAGLQRLRLVVVDISAPIATFADGPIVTCTFQVKPGASGAATVVAGDRLNVGDAHGDVFGSRAVSGGVSILIPTATPAPVPTARPFCPGDCDGDGNVLVNEITLGVRILAGEAQLKDCPAADADGDGVVLVTDITRAIVSLAFGCPK